MCVLHIVIVAACWFFDFPVCVALSRAHRHALSSSVSKSVIQRRLDWFCTEAAQIWCKQHLGFLDLMKKP